MLLYNLVLKLTSQVKFDLSLSIETKKKKEVKYEN